MNHLLREERARWGLACRSCCEVVAVVAMRSKLFRNLALGNFEREATPLQGQCFGWQAMNPSISE